MIKNLYLIALLCKIVNGILPFDDIQIVLNNEYIMNDIIEPTIEPTLQPIEIPLTTFNPTTFNPSTINPTTFNPSTFYQSTFYPTTFYPTIANRSTYMPTPSITSEPINKILNFEVNMQLSNYSRAELNEIDKEVLLLSFQQISDINRQYLSIKNKNIRKRKLYKNILSNIFYQLEEIIVVSIPLINKYKIYESDPIELYDSLSFLITNSTNSGLFLLKIKENSLILNSTSFNYIDIYILSIDEPRIRTINKDNKKLTDKKIILIISLSLLGLIIIFSIITYILFHPKNVNLLKHVDSILTIRNRVNDFNDTSSKIVVVNIDDTNLNDNSFYFFDENNLIEDNIIDTADTRLHENINQLSIVEMKENEGFI